MLWLVLLFVIGSIWLLIRPNQSLPLKKPSQSAGLPGFTYARTLHSKVHGVSYRQDAASRCREGDALRLGREPLNPHDHNAIAIHHWVSGEQLGYLSRHLAEEFAPKLDSGRWQLVAHISAITGKEIVGLNIQIDLYRKAAKPKAATG